MQLSSLKKYFKSFLFACYGLFFYVAAVNAQSIDELVKQAEFVFEGKVINVQYQYSQKSTGGSSGIPYSFVTYQIVNILKGNYGSSLITLRFIGGPSEDGSFFSMEGTPRFDVGDHDVLLVSQNGYQLCPLVNCAQGRFRYINGLVVNEYGQLIEIRNGQLHLGQMVDLDEVTTHKMGDMTLTRREVREVDGEEVPVAIPRAQADTGLVPDTAGFTSYIQEKISSGHDAGELAALPPYHSADPEAAFTDELLERIYTPAEEPASMRAPESKREKAKKPAQPSVATQTEPSVAPLQEDRLQHQEDVRQELDTADATLTTDGSGFWRLIILLFGGMLIFFILARRVR